MTSKVVPTFKTLGIVTCPKCKDEVEVTFENIKTLKVDCKCGGGTIKEQIEQWWAAKIGKSKRVGLLYGKPGFGKKKNG